MAPYAPLLLISALCIGSALSLQCYTCNGESTNANCLTPATCTGNQTYCMTSVVGFGGVGSAIVKNCTDTCQEATFNFIMTGYISCCKTNLCNSGGSSVKSTYTVLAAALGFLGALWRRSV